MTVLAPNCITQVALPAIEQGIDAYRSANPMNTGGGYAMALRTWDALGEEDREAATLLIRKLRRDTGHKADAIGSGAYYFADHVAVCAMGLPIR